MSQEYIQIRGARENNLKDVSLRLPKRKITVFTGVSGSGKSSLVFDTLAAEAQRRLYENFSLFVRNFLPHYPQPDADAIENLSMAVIVDQKRLGGGSHSTVGTITDIAPLLRLLFSRGGKPYVGHANAFSFNDLAGMCPECKGVGRTIGVKLETLVDVTKSLNEGAIIAPGFNDWDRQTYAREQGFDNNKKLSDFTRDEMQRLLYAEPHTFKIKGQAGLKLAGGGVVVRFNRKFTPGVDADPQLKDELFMELPGILRKALEAYGDAVFFGEFTEPASCREAKQEWRMEADQAAQFLAEQCSEGKEIGSTELFQAYQEWAFAQGIKQRLSHKSLTDRVIRLGYSKARRNRGMVILNLHLTPKTAAKWRGWPRA